MWRIQHAALLTAAAQRLTQEQRQDIIWQQVIMKLQITRKAVEMSNSLSHKD
jgi:lipase chaperone LimK